MKLSKHRILGQIMNYSDSGRIAIWKINYSPASLGRPIRGSTDPRLFRPLIFPDFNIIGCQVNCEILINSAY